MQTLETQKGDGTRGHGCVGVGVAVSWNSDNTFSFFATTSTTRGEVVAASESGARTPEEVWI